MWRCTKCNFLHTVNELPRQCNICRGDGFIEVLIGKKAGTGSRSRQDAGMVGRPPCAGAEGR